MVRKKIGVQGCWGAGIALTYCLQKCSSVSTDLALKNICPISKRQFVPKLVERTVSNQLQFHLVKNNLLPTLQSAYRPNQTALLKFKNDILINMDKQHATLQL